MYDITKRYYRCDCCGGILEQSELYEKDNQWVDDSNPWGTGNRVIHEVVTKSACCNSDVEEVDPLDLMIARAK